MGDYVGYKRARMDMPDPMMGDVGYGGYGMAALPLFPCVKLRGLPFDVTDDDIRMFLVRVGASSSGRSSSAQQRGAAA